MRLQSHDWLTSLELEVLLHDAYGDRAGAAAARFALGRVLLALEEPAGREILEDAGTCYEELGDQAGLVAVDDALRSAAVGFEESPRSFQSTYSRSSVPPPLLSGGTAPTTT